MGWEFWFEFVLCVPRGLVLLDMLLFILCSLYSISSLDNCFSVRIVWFMVCMSILGFNVVLKGMLYLLGMGRCWWWASCVFYWALLYTFSIIFFGYLSYIAFKVLKFCFLWLSFWSLFFIYIGRVGNVFCNLFWKPWFEWWLAGRLFSVSGGLDRVFG